MPLIHMYKPLDATAKWNTQCGEEGFVTVSPDGVDCVDCLRAYIKRLPDKIRAEAIDDALNMERLFMGRSFVYTGDLIRLQNCYKKGVKWSRS